MVILSGGICTSGGGPTVHQGVGYVCILVSENIYLR